MATIKVRKWREGDRMNLRPLDAQGVTVLSVSPEEALAHAVALSVDHFIYEEEGEVLGAWGYGAHSLAGVSAYGWLLTSPRAARHAVLLARESRRAVSHILSLYLRLEVTCLYAHPTSRRWLDWLGFAECGRTSDFLILEKVR